ncbi:uncharacterized protein LOC124160602 [Ischnura elegans]|uniref:uncharacterized protein LOC124160602 n=1 Tax=Ischnura elegans TaxID=197161 RepID=UPI001ED8B6B6|nr:uncharacterized protein LOC124160602 [Ischnura elegans]
MASSEMASLVSRQHLLESIRILTGRSDVVLMEDVDVHRATTGVEGFLSIVLRVKVSYHFQDDQEIRRKTFVVKRFPQTEMLVEFSQRSGIFTREGTFLDKVVSIMKRLSDGKVEIPLPECYHIVYGGDDDTIVMEDLSEGGYRTPSPSYLSEGLDLCHCRLAMQKLGTLHGFAVAAERSLPPEIGGWLGAFPPFSQEVCFYEAPPGVPPSPLTGMTLNAIETILMLSKNIDGLPKEAEESGKLEKVLEGLWSTLCRLVKANPGSPNVPCHGDCWMNNMMFLYEGPGSGRPVDLKFIDLQVTRYCHPAIDILYFMYLSTSRSFRENHLDDLLAVYHASMKETLEAVSGGTPPLSLEQLRKDVHVQFKPFGVIIGAVMTPFFMLGEDFVKADADQLTPSALDDMLKTGNADAVRNRYAQDAKFKTRMEEVISELVEVAFPRGLNSTDTSPLLQQ